MWAGRWGAREAGHERELHSIDGALAQAEFQSTSSQAIRDGGGIDGAFAQAREQFAMVGAMAYKRHTTGVSDAS
ncbi:unnamed protein product [Calypogeia fissa]